MSIALKSLAFLLAFGCHEISASPADYSLEASSAIGALPPNLKLRVLPLGDSITFGMGSTSMNGYRADLYKQLTQAGATVDFVGSQKSGNFEKPNHEGYPGNLINQISAKADKALALKPNVVCVMGGTNDLAFGNFMGQDPKEAPQRMGALIDKIIKAVPDVVVLVASLTPLNSGNPEPFNKAIPDVVKARSDQGQKVALADMSAVAKNELKDGVHPNDAGYAKMATAWFKAIELAASKGWIKDPA